MDGFFNVIKHTRKYETADDCMNDVSLTYNFTFQKTWMAMDEIVDGQHIYRYLSGAPL